MCISDSTTVFMPVNGRKMSSDMNDLQIKCFLTVAKNLSFSRAAEELFTSQPSISKHIHNFENELGTKLFDRSGQKLRLTPSGEKFYDFFTRFNAEYRYLKNTILASEQEEMKIRIAILQGSNFFDDLFPIFNKVHSAYPNLKTEMSFHGFKSIIEAIKNEEADIIIHLKDLCEHMPRMNIVPLKQIPKILFYRRDLFPEGFCPSSLKDFSDQIFLITEESECPGVKQSNLRLTADYGFSPDFKIVPNIESMFWGVKHGDGVAVMDSSITWGKDNIESFVLPETHTIVMVWPKASGNPAAALFTSEFLKVFNEESHLISHHK